MQLPLRAVVTRGRYLQTTLHYSQGMKSAAKTVTVQVFEGRPVGWTSSFASSAQKLVKEKSFAVKMQTLLRLEKEVRVPSFIYPDEDSLRIGMKSLLLILSHLISNLDSFPLDHLQACLLMSEAIVSREEFDLGKLFPEDEKEQDPLLLPIFKEYRALLVQLQKWVVQKLAGKAIVDPRKSFCINCLPIFYFRLPLLCGFILDAVCFNSSEENPSLSAEVQLVDKELDELILSHTIAEHSTFPDSKLYYKKNPNLFQWNYFFELDDPEMMLSIKAAFSNLQERLSTPEFFFPIASKILSHVFRHSPGLTRWELVHGYWTLARAFFSRVEVIPWKSISLTS